MRERSLNRRNKRRKEWNDRNFIKKISFLSHSLFNLDVISFTLLPSSWISLLQESIHHHQIGWQSRGREGAKKKKKEESHNPGVSEREKERKFVSWILSQSVPILWPQFCIHFLLLLDWNESLGVWKGKKHNMIKDGNGKMRVKNPQKLIIKSDHKWIPLMIFSQVLQLLWSSCIIHVFHNSFIPLSFILFFTISFIFSLIHVVLSPIWSSPLHPLIPNNLFQSIEVFNERVMHHHHHPMHKDRRHSLLSYSPFHVHKSFSTFIFHEKSFDSFDDLSTSNYKGKTCNEHFFSFKSCSQWTSASWIFHSSWLFSALFKVSVPALSLRWCKVMKHSSPGWFLFVFVILSLSLIFPSSYFDPSEILIAILTD